MDDDLTSPSIETRSECKARFQAEVEAALLPVKSRYLYLDTAQIWTHLRLSKADEATLHGMLPQLSPGKARLWIEALGWKSKANRFGPPRKHEWRYRIVIQQPTKDALAFIAARYAGGEDEANEHMINRMHFALDLCVAGFDDAHTLQTFLDRHLTAKWNANRSSQYEGTSYGGPAQSKRQIVTYSDLKSKVRDVPAAHVEFRFDSASLCARLGLRQLPRVLQCEANILDKISRYYHLSVVWPKRLAKEFAKLDDDVFFARILSCEDDVRLTPATICDARCQAILDLRIDYAAKKTADSRLWFDKAEVMLDDAVIHGGIAPLTRDVEMAYYSSSCNEISS